jgi:molecular chaperone DnaK
VDVTQSHPEAKARLWWAAEEAKKKLSQEPYVVIREEALVTRSGKPLHLEMELSRSDYESLIRPLVESTLDSVSKALQDSGRRPGDMDAILLVGGSTRTPLVFSLLTDMMGTEPRQDIHPDLCVALGAGVLASRLAGQQVERVLVDVSPYSFGVSYLGERGGFPYPHCFKPIIRRNTPLPLTRTEMFSTSHPYQTVVDIQVYQGDDDDALKNIPVGDFRVEGLTEIEDANEILCRMRLDLDGILEVAAVEKRTGKSKQITIANSLQAKTAEEIAAGRKRIQEMFESRAESFYPELDHFEELQGDSAHNVIDIQAESPSLPGESEAEELMVRSRRLLDNMHAEDREEAIGLHEQIGEAIAVGDETALANASRALREMLFFMEGKPN